MALAGYLVIEVVRLFVWNCCRRLLPSGGYAVSVDHTGGGYTSDHQASYSLLEGLNCLQVQDIFSRFLCLRCSMYQQGLVVFQSF